MAKKRVYEIARERGLQTQQVMRRLKDAGVDVKAAASTVSDEDIEKVFGKKQESVSPAGQSALPSWLSPTAAPKPKTALKSDIDAKAEERQQKITAATTAKARAVEQAKRLRAQMAEKKARLEADAAAQAEAAPHAAAAEAEEAATAAAEAEAAPAAEAEAEAPEVTDVETDAPEAPEADVVDEPAPDLADQPAFAAAFAAATENGAAPAEAPVEEVVDEAPVAEVVDVEEEPATPAAPLTERDLQKRAQVLAAQRVADQAARKRAALEAEKLEVAQREKSGDKTAKKKDKKKKDAAAAPAEEFVGSRKPRIGGASRESLSDAERGSRRGPSRKRRVVIDAQASRRGPGGGGSGRGPNKRDRREAKEAARAEVDPTIPVTIHAGATVKEFADALKVPSTEIITAMMALGDFVTITQSLTNEQMELVGVELERIVEIKSAADDEVIPVFEDTDEELLPRAPVVTIMGHVDHGKTSLLDAIRETKVAEGEAGGITQHIGAYQVTMPDGRSVTFLDTPGHEAFTALRARGAKVTDEAVLVVAADDGVKPQTIEAIDHARAAGVPIVVAINKIDKENAQPEKVKSELAQHDLQPEEWGGKTVMVEVSAKKRENLDDLIEMILLQADILELRSNPNTEASGYIIESKLDPGRGPLATMLIARGTLRVGDAIVAGDTWGKVRAMNDFRGKRVKEAPPSTPVEIVGFDSVPTAGEFCQVVESDRVARDKAAKRAHRLKAEKLAKRQRGMSLDDIFSRIKDGEVQDLNLVIKADVAGSVEALEQELGKIQHDEVKVRIIRSGVGGITGSDVMLASASEAIILGFNVRPNAEARETAQREGVDVRTYSIIYKLREDVEAALTGMLSPEEVEETMGEAEVRQIFKASKIGTIAGCMVTQGKIERSAKVRLLRDGTIVHDGTLSSLKRFKEDVRDVAQGYECGIAIEGYNDVKEGDVIEAYSIKQVQRDLKGELTGASAG